jgi:hypothetical protein
MKIRKFSGLILLLFLFNTNIFTQTYIAPQLEFVCELKVTVGPEITLGSTSHGVRKMIPITGGTFEGPKLNGVVLEGGADYQYADLEKGRTEIEAIYTIKTFDNVFIHVRNVGLYYISEDLRVQMKEGNKFDFDKVYFRAAPKFEAPNDSKYDWMNNAIFICKAVPFKDYVSIQVWKVL